MERVDILKRHLAAPTASPTSYLQTDTYRYTLPIADRIITKEQREHYEKHGFLVIRNLVSQDKLDRYRHRFQQICSGEVSRETMTVMRDVAIARSEFTPGEQAVTKLQNFENDPVMFEYCSLPEIVHYARCFLGENIMSMHTMLINKPPDPGTKTSRHPMHQDLHYFPFRPADRIVCSWTAMQDINRRNGCLVVIPGSHINPGVLLEHGYPKWEGGVNKAYHGILNYDPEKDTRIHLEMGPGDTVFFHPLLVHGSGMNKSDGFRKSISCHYASSECDYIDVSGTIQAGIEHEIRGMLKNRVKGLDDEMLSQVQLKDIWRAKGRKVHGKSVNL